MPNGGLQVVAPSKKIYELILDHLTTSAITNYDFADQSLLGDLFADRWVTLPYTYNALKTLRDCHSEIWKDGKVKNVHYILDKPWDEKPEDAKNETHKWWHQVNAERVAGEKLKGLSDGF